MYPSCYGSQSFQSLFTTTDMYVSKKDSVNTLNVTLIFAYSESWSLKLSD